MRRLRRRLQRQRAASPSTSWCAASASRSAPRRVDTCDGDRQQPRRCRGGQRAGARRRPGAERLRARPRRRSAGQPAGQPARRVRPRQRRAHHHRAGAACDSERAGVPAAGRQRTLRRRRGHRSAGGASWLGHLLARRHVSAEAPVAAARRRDARRRSDRLRDRRRAAACSAPPSARQGMADGQLIVFFPPDYTQSCILDQTPEHAGDAGRWTTPARSTSPQAGPPGSVLRFAPPFPATAAECGSVVPTKAPVHRLHRRRRRARHRPRAERTLVRLAGRRPAAQPAGIREHDADGTFIREVLPPGDWGNPAGLAFDAAGSLYYADLGLNDQFQTVPGGATVRQVTFGLDGTPAEPELIAGGLNFADGVAVLPSRADGMADARRQRAAHLLQPARARDQSRHGAAACSVKWRYLTSGMISAQPVVTWVDLPGEGRTQIVIVSSWDRTSTRCAPRTAAACGAICASRSPGTFYPFAGTPTIAWIDGQQRVFVPGGETMYCLDATTGEEIWQFDAGTGCTDLHAAPGAQRDRVDAGGRQRPGHLRHGRQRLRPRARAASYASTRATAAWCGASTSRPTQTCRPFAGDDIRRFDGYHSEAELGLPEDFLATRPGCDFDRTGNACGNVWSSPAVDLRRGLFYIALEQLRHRRRSGHAAAAAADAAVRRGDLRRHARRRAGLGVAAARGRQRRPLLRRRAEPLRSARSAAQVREVVGIGGKDGTYYVLDRDGVNEITGRDRALLADQRRARRPDRRHDRRRLGRRGHASWSPRRPASPLHAAEADRARLRRRNRRGAVAELERRPLPSGRPWACRGWRSPAARRARPSTSSTRDGGRCIRARAGDERDQRRRLRPHHRRRHDVRRRRHRRLQRGLARPPARRVRDTPLSAFCVRRHAGLHAQHLQRRQHLHLRLPRRHRHLRQRAGRRDPRLRDQRHARKLRRGDLRGEHAGTDADCRTSDRSSTTEVRRGTAVGRGGQRVCVPLRSSCGAPALASPQRWSLLRRAC